MQVDFLDSSSSAKHALTGDAAPPPPPGGVSGAGDLKTEDPAQDGRLGFVQYEPSVLQVSGEAFSSLEAYAAYAGANRALVLRRVSTAWTTIRDRSTHGK